MKQLLVLATLLAYSLAQDEDCSAKIEEFFQCKAQVKASLPPRGEKAQCFTDAGCSAPQWHSENAKEFFECVHQVAQEAQTDCEQSEGLPDFPDVGSHGHHGHHHHHHGGKDGTRNNKIGGERSRWAEKKEQMISEACQQDETKISQVKACWENKREAKKAMWDNIRSEMEACHQNLEPCKDELQSHKETLCSCMTNKAETDQNTIDALEQCEALKGDTENKRMSSDRIFSHMCRRRRGGWGRKDGRED